MNTLTKRVIIGSILLFLGACTHYPQRQVYYPATGAYPVYSSGTVISQRSYYGGYPYPSSYAAYPVYGNFRHDYHDDWQNPILAHPHKLNNHQHGRLSPKPKVYRTPDRPEARRDHNRRPRQNQWEANKQAVNEQRRNHIKPDQRFRKVNQEQLQRPRKIHREDNQRSTTGAGIYGASR